MDTEIMIRELERVEEKHKHDKVFTGQLDVAKMAHDTRKRLEELKPYEDTGLTPEQIRELTERDTAMEINEILAEQRITAIKAWKSIKDDGLPPVGSCLIVTIKNHGYGGRRELRYPVHYLEKNYAPGYAFYMNGTDILLPEYSEVVAWMHVPTPYEGE